MLGRYVGVSATIVDLPALSVHADQEELLLWMAGAPTTPETTFVVHGEPAASSALRARIQNDLGWTAAAPSYQERVRLD
jgi:metallo-beta-lactamase family protein